MSSIKVEGKNSKGEDIVCFVRKPTAKDSREAKLYANLSASKLIKSGTFLTRSQARDQLKKSGIWTDIQDDELIEIQKQVTFYATQLQSGQNEKGEKLKKSEGRTVALKLVQLRNDQLELLVKVNELDEYTIEALTENDEFDFLVSVCIQDEEGNDVFKSVDDYKERAADEPYFFSAAQKLQNVIHGYKDLDTITKERIEYKFLKQYGFINDKLQFINKDGHLTDRDGKLVDDEGFYLDDNNERVKKAADTVGEFDDD